jgi:DNA-binding NtrC family response regulator
MIEPIGPPNPERPRVMIVDDDAEMRSLLRDLLEHEGFHVREHDTADGLMPLIAAWAPHVVVLDKEMAGSSGLDVLRHMRQRHPQTPVVLVTAFGGAEVEAEARRLGAAYYMDKPFRVTRLLEILHTVVRPLEGKGRPVGIGNVDRA